MAIEPTIFLIFWPTSLFFLTFWPISMFLTFWPTQDNNQVSIVIILFFALEVGLTTRFIRNVIAGHIVNNSMPFLFGGIT